MPRFYKAYSYAEYLIFGSLTASPSGLLWLFMLAVNDTISIGAFGITFLMGIALAFVYALWQSRTQEPIEPETVTYETAPAETDLGKLSELDHQ